MSIIGHGEHCAIVREGEGTYGGVCKVRDLGEEELKVRLKELLSNQEHNDEESEEEEGHDD